MAPRRNLLSLHTVKGEGADTELRARGSMARLLPRL